MNSVLQNISTLAIWGSFSATFILGLFFLVQAAVDRPRRIQFGMFAATMGYLAGLDLARTLLGLDPLVYEWNRLWWGVAYVGCSVWLVLDSWRLAAAASAGVALLGFGTYLAAAPLATTLTFPFVFGAPAAAFLRRYLRERGYASAVLASTSAALAITCSTYFLVVGRGLAPTLLGYLHYAILSILSVLLGWIHLTRELAGRAPVQTSPRMAVFLGAGILCSQIAVTSSLHTYRDGVPIFFGLASLAQFGSMVAVFLHHRHQLVIHASNVGQLLLDRTAELRQAREEVARQNGLLAERLSLQARELQAKTEVIDRQRRLELAAQTAGQVAHDIQNLISPILARAQDLERVEGPGELRDISGDIRRQVRELLDLNTQLLALSRRGRIEREPVLLSEVARDAAARFPGQRITLQAEGEAWVRGSWAQLSRALANLISNALESDLDRLVAVTLRTRIVPLTENFRCHLGFLAPGAYSVLEIEDQGPGIPEAHRDQIFEPFYSTKSGNHRSGSGLGLTIVAAVVDDHGGVLDLATGPGGTKFTLYFPAAPPPAAAAEPEPPSSPATVLVVDDDSAVLEECGPLLRSAGYSVVSARSGEQAIRVLQAEEVDLLLLDLALPQMKGLDTLLGALHLRPNVRTVVHSSQFTPEEEARLRAFGVVALLQKPAGRREILRALRQAYDERPSVPDGLP